MEEGVLLVADCGGNCDNAGKLGARFGALGVLLSPKVREADGVAKDVDVEAVPPERLVLDGPFEASGDGPTVDVEPCAESDE